MKKLLSFIGAAGLFATCSMTAVSCGTKNDSNVNGGGTSDDDSGGTSDDDGDKKTLSNFFKVTNLGILTVVSEYSTVNDGPNAMSREFCIANRFISANHLKTGVLSNQHLLDLLQHTDDEGEIKPRTGYVDELNNLPITVDGDSRGTFTLSLLKEVIGNFGGDSDITIIPSEITVSFALKFNSW